METLGNKPLNKRLTASLEEIGAVAKKIKQQLPPNSEAIIEVSASNGFGGTPDGAVYKLSIRVLGVPRC